MRRSDREITDRAEIDEILNANAVCTIALADGGTPYAVTMNYGYADGCLYLHCAREGRKIDILRRNPAVAFSVYDSAEIVGGKEACDWTSRYRSVYGEGKAEFLESVDEKRRGLLALMRQTSGSAAWDIPDRALGQLNVIAIRIAGVSGKKHV